MDISYIILAVEALGGLFGLIYFINVIDRSKRAAGWQRMQNKLSNEVLIIEQRIIKKTKRFQLTIIYSGIIIFSILNVAILIKLSTIGMGVK